MKKLLIASLMMIASHSIFAADTNTSRIQTLAKATQLYEAKNYTEAFQEMQHLANTGNPQAIYNVGYMTQIKVHSER